MGFDSISNVHECTFAKDFSKKKRVNKMGKLKQNKFVFGREQCLIQVASKEHIGGANCQSFPKHNEGRQKQGNLPSTVRRDTKESGKTDRALLSNDLFYRRRSISSSSGSCSSSCSEDDRDKAYLDDWDRQTVSKGHQAWSPDDVFRPQSLPRVSRQHDNNNNLMHFSPRDHNSAQSSVCPICCEDLDVTDSSFLPCPCGFRLCLFCHKTIIEVDGRCPGCRKQYSPENTSASDPCR